MQTMGVLLLVAAVWLVYCGVTGVPAWDTVLAIIKEPGRASEIIAEAKKAVADKVNASTSDFSIVNSLVGGIDPFSGKYEISDDWDDHVNRKGADSSKGGVDFMMPVGTPLPTPFEGVVTFDTNGGSAGYIATVALDNGWKLQYLHVSEFIDKHRGKRVKPGTIIAKSGGAKGAVGAGSSTGAHVHVHMINPQGQRVDYRNYIRDLQTSKAIQYGVVR